MRILKTAKEVADAVESGLRVAVCASTLSIGKTLIEDVQEHLRSRCVFVGSYLYAGESCGFVHLVLGDTHNLNGMVYDAAWGEWSAMDRRVSPRIRRSTDAIKEGGE